MPVYNTKKYLKESIKSVLCQSYTDFELIIVDDGSTDGSKDIEEKAKSSDDRVKIICLEKNMGVANARNTGLHAAAGKYILFLDSDDVLLPEALSCMVNAADRNDADMVIGNYIYRYMQKSKDIQGSFLEPAVYRDYDIIKCIHFSCLHGTKLFRRKILVENKLLNPPLRMGEDLAFYNECLAYSKCVVTIKEPVLLYRMYEGSSSKSYSMKTMDFLKAFDIVEECYKKNNLWQFNDEFLFDEFFYITGNIKKLPRHRNRRERIDLFDEFVEYGNSKDESSIQKGITAAMAADFEKIKRRKWLYTSSFTTAIYRTLRKIKHSIGGAKWRNLNERR